MLIWHGDNVVLSREAFVQAKKELLAKQQSVTELNGDELTLEQLQQVLAAQSLFGESSVPIVEGFFARRPSNAKKAVIEYLEKNPLTNALFWDGKDVSTQLKTLPPAAVKKFDLPKHVFKFLDTLSITDLQATLATTPSELVLALLIGHVRKLIMVLEGAVNLPAWQAGKLKVQAKSFGLDKLVAMHGQLLKIDYQQKTSASALGLDAGLELFVTKASSTK